MRKMSLLKTILVVIVSLQLGVLMPLAPVWAQETSEVDNAPSTTVAPDIVLDEGSPVLPDESEKSALDESLPVVSMPVQDNSTSTVESVAQPVVTEAEAATAPAGKADKHNDKLDKGLAEQNNKPKQNDESTVAPVVSSPVSDPELLQPKLRSVTYNALMNDIKNVRVDKNLSKKDQVISDFEQFLLAEKDRLDKLDVSWLSKRKYINRLKGQLKAMSDNELSGLARIWEKTKILFGLEPEELVFDEETLTRESASDIKVPNDPSEFRFNQEKPILMKLNNTKAGLGQEIDSAIKSYITVEEAKADSAVMPVLADVKEDGGEVVINEEISRLAKELGNNPVNIYNYVRSNISYEPYFGAKKGSIGCLQEKICNDVDAASLTISLLRAAGIPANYKKNTVVVSVAELQEILGLEKNVETRRTVYGVFGWNKVPVFSISDNPSVGENLDSADFSSETHFAIEWTFPQMYYEFDERGGNINNLTDLSLVTTTEDLQLKLQNQFKKQWVPMDVIFKSYARSQKEIVADTAAFNSESFWYSYFQYQGNLSPFDKYVTDLNSVTGKNVSTTAYQSVNVPVKKDFDKIPPTLPYLLVSGVDSSGNELIAEIWSSVPDNRKQQVKIQIQTEDNDVVLEKTFFGSEINNKELNLSYEGSEESDKAIIESYGGIYITPAELVNIKPYIVGESDRFEAIRSVNIGQSLTLRFEYFVNGTLQFSDEKLSVAGNQEGIYVVLSKVQSDPYLNNDSRILMRGNVGLAREYLLQIQKSGEVLANSLDYNYDISFSRAVVTQNRILNTVNGTPTTFDFKGLTLDASAYIKDWSNRGNYKSHRKDLRLLWGLEASYWEGQIFSKVANLDGISTVKGLQYAYANPSQYNVSIIKSDNESVIDSLELSANTKANMHADVQAGNTIVTPNKMVGAGNWNGIFYVSLDPDWTGTYAIGEQAQSNGGWTTNQYTITNWTAEDATNHFAYEVAKGPDMFIYKDDADRNVLCSIDVQTYNYVVGGNIAPGWSLAKYGKPCMGVEMYMFGEHDHAFLLATNGSYYFSSSDGYSDWLTNQALVEKFYQYYPGSYNGIKRLFPYWGTYANKDDDLERMLIYNPKLKRPYSIIGEMYESYISNNLLYGTYVGGKVETEYAPGLLGFPSSESSVAAEYYDGGLDGYYQQFTNGTMYLADRIWPIANDVSIVIGNMNVRHNSGGGTYGMGFPLRNPGLSTQCASCIVQSFENGKNIVLNMANGETYLTDTLGVLAVNRDFQGEDWEEFLEGIQDAIYELDIYSITVNAISGVAVADVMTKLGPQLFGRFGAKATLRTSARFVPYAGWVFAGVTASMAALENRPLYLACTSDPTIYIEGKRTSYYCGKLGVNGLAFVAGATANVLADKLNLLGAVSKLARAGKAKLFTDIDVNNGQIMKKLLSKNPVTKNGFLEVVDRLDDFSVNTLKSNDWTARVLLEKPIYQETFDGFVNGGDYHKAVKRRVDLKYQYEFDNYTKPIAFDMKKTIDKGIGKIDHYSIGEVGSLLEMYHLRNFAKVVDGKQGEIIFITKTDGTAVFAPREYNDYLPHAFVAKGQDVISAGTIRPEIVNGKVVPNKVVISNKSGHYKFHESELAPIIREFEDNGYTVIFDPQTY